MQSGQVRQVAAAAVPAVAANGIALRLQRTSACRRHIHLASQRRVAASTVMGVEETVSYEWSWRQIKSRLPEQPSAFDAAHPLPAQPHAQDVILLLQKAVDCASHDDVQQQPSQAWMDALLAQVQPMMQQLAASDTCELCQQLSQLDYVPEPQLMSALLQQLCLQAAQLSTQQLSELLWSLSNLRHTLEQQQWAALLQTAAAQLQDFYGPDLARLVCAAGSIYSSSNTGVALAARAAASDAGSAPAEATIEGAVAAGLVLPDGWADAVAGEVEYQVVEFVGDLAAFDLARLASGLADLGVSPSARLQDALLKAVYMRTRSIEEKGAVDFALAKLDAKGKRSMHFDPRWTHEELNWLPRRERDKRRMIKEGWYRTQWGGWRSGQ